MSMDLKELVVVKGLAGKQNKKKWKKNIDVSGLLHKIQQQQNEEARLQFLKPLIVENTTISIREDLDPNRFKRPKPQPKALYDNSYKRDNLIGDAIVDAWEGVAPTHTRNKQQISVPSIIMPSSGHSYNPTEGSVEKIIEEVVDYEEVKPKKAKKIKKLKEVKVVPRSRNPKLRRQFLEARQRKLERKRTHDINSIKQHLKEIQDKMKVSQQKELKNQEFKRQRMEECQKGKVRQGPKLGKIRYQYKQHIPTQEETTKKMSHVAQTQQLIREQYDSIFRRGLMEPRNIVVHANKTKNIKVTEKFEDD